MYEDSMKYKLEDPVRQDNKYLFEGPKTLAI